MISLLRRLIPERSPWRLWYHKLQAVVAAFYFRFPAQKLKVIGVTGTSGKSTTVELIHYLIQGAGTKCGQISGIQYRVGEKCIPNKTLRTTVRPWTTQKLLRQMVNEGCEFCVIEVSSHALDQNRLWGVAFDTAVLTNVLDNEHLDYHLNFAEYVRTKTKLFRNLNTSYRKPHVPKISVINRDDENYDIFEEFTVDRQWSFSMKQAADVKAENINLKASGSEFWVQLPNHHVVVSTSIVGSHNVQNLLAAIATASANGVTVDNIEKLFKEFPGIPGRLEPIDEGQRFSTIVDFSYKPSALESVLKTLKGMIDGRLIIVFGGTSSRTRKNLKICGQLIDQYADEVVLTTDDPNNEDPKEIAAAIKSGITRDEGEDFFEIEDRYEAIRYGIYIAEPGDCVLIAGRGHETVQTIGAQKIPFDDRSVAREILQFAQKDQLLD